MSRVVFGRLVLQQKLGLPLEDTLRLLFNQQELCYDVTVRTDKAFARVREAYKSEAASRPLAAFRVLGMDRPSYRNITVTTYSPYVSDEEVAAFLGRYGEVTPGVWYIRDPNGYWSGGRVFGVLLHQDPKGQDGLRHPPALFSIGVERGYLFYGRQPPFCRKCREAGHSEGACAGAACRSCGHLGHVARSCPEARTCHGCGERGHLSAACPRRIRTYADVVGGLEEAEGLEDVVVPVEKQDREETGSVAGPGTQDAAQEATGVEVLEEAPAPLPSDDSSEEDTAGPLDVAMEVSLGSPRRKGRRGGKKKRDEGGEEGRGKKVRGTDGEGGEAVAAPAECGEESGASGSGPLFTPLPAL